MAYRFYYMCQFSPLVVAAWNSILRRIIRQHLSFPGKTVLID